VGKQNFFKSKLKLIESSIDDDEKQVITTDTNDY